MNEIKKEIEELKDYIQDDNTLLDVQEDDIYKRIISILEKLAKRVDMLEEAVC